MSLRKVAIHFDPALCWLLAAFVLTVPVRLLAGWMIAVLVHELGHYLALRLFWIPVDSVRFGLSGASMHTRKLTCFETLICAAAGPAAGISLVAGAKLHPVASVCGFVHGIYNLLPFPGFDGDRILDAICCILFSGNTSQLVRNGLRAVILLIVFAWLLHFVLS